LATAKEILQCNSLCGSKKKTNAKNNNIKTTKKEQEEW
jgi:hypothetical protein